jgi:hypothetical protein
MDRHPADYRLDAIVLAEVPKKPRGIIPKSAAKESVLRRKMQRARADFGWPRFGKEWRISQLLADKRVMARFAREGGVRESLRPVPHSPCWLGGVLLLFRATVWRADCRARSWLWLSVHIKF